MAAGCILTGPNSRWLSSCPDSLQTRGPGAHSSLSPGMWRSPQEFSWCDCPEVQAHYPSFKVNLQKYLWVSREFLLVMVCIWRTLRTLLEIVTSESWLEAGNRWHPGTWISLSECIWLGWRPRHRWPQCPGPLRILFPPSSPRLYIHYVNVDNDDMVSLQTRWCNVLTWNVVSQNFTPSRD